MPDKTNKYQERILRQSQIKALQEQQRDWRLVRSFEQNPEQREVLDTALGVARNNIQNLRAQACRTCADTGLKNGFPCPICGEE